MRVRGPKSVTVMYHTVGARACDARQVPYGQPMKKRKLVFLGFNYYLQLVSLLLDGWYAMPTEITVIVVIFLRIYLMTSGVVWYCM